MRNRHSRFFLTGEHHLVSGVQFGGTPTRQRLPCFLYLRFRGLKIWHCSMSSNCVNFSQPTSRVDAQVSHVIGRSQVNPSSSPNKNAIASSSHFRRLTNMRRIRTSNMRKRQIGQDPRLQKRLYYCVI